MHTPLQVPEEYISQTECQNIHGLRSIFCGMMKALDEGISNITSLLKAKGMFEDTLIVFSTVCGSWMDEWAGPDMRAGQRRPSIWRRLELATPVWGSDCITLTSRLTAHCSGDKETVWEGGIRGNGFVSGWGVPAHLQVRRVRICVSSLTSLRTRPTRTSCTSLTGCPPWRIW